MISRITNVSPSDRSVASAAKLLSCGVVNCTLKKKRPPVVETTDGCHRTKSTSSNCSTWRQLASLRLMEDQDVCISSGWLEKMNCFVFVAYVFDIDLYVMSNGPFPWRHTAHVCSLQRKYGKSWQSSSRYLSMAPNMRLKALCGFPSINFPCYAVSQSGSDRALPEFPPLFLYF